MHIDISKLKGNTNTVNLSLNGNSNNQYLHILIYDLIWFLSLFSDYTEPIINAPFGFDKKHMKVPTNEERIKVSETDARTG